MPNPAARTGDPTAHGTPLGPGPGSVNVMIGGKPAWRVGLDFHQCPLATPAVPPVPHVGGPVSMGSTTVSINNAPAARMGDQITENGPPNAITMGCPTVLFG